MRTVLARLSLAFLITIAVLAILAPQVTHYTFSEQNISERLQPPSLTHWMGTDLLGRDVYSRIIYGARMSLAVGAMTALLAFLFGTAVGLVAGYWGGWKDTLLMRIVDLFMIFPSILLAILIMLVFGRGTLGIFVALGLSAWMTHARLVRGLTLQIRGQDFIEAAHALGANSTQILTRHILPNLWAPISVSLTYQIPTHMMAESFLSFIGLGIQPPFSSWGTLANEGFRAMQSYPHLILFPGGILFLTLLAFNFVGDSLSELPVKGMPKKNHSPYRPPQ